MEMVVKIRNKWGLFNRTSLEAIVPVGNMCVMPFFCHKIRGLGSFSLFLERTIQPISCAVSFRFEIIYHLEFMTVVGMQDPPLQTLAVSQWTCQDLTPEASIRNMHTYPSGLETTVYMLER